MVPLSDPVSGQLVVRGPASGPTTLELALQGGEATFAQGDVWEITFVDTTRRATLLHVTSTPTAYTLHETAGAGCGGCLSGTIVAR